MAPPEAEQVRPRVRSAHHNPAATNIVRAPPRSAPSIGNPANSPTATRTAYPAHGARTLASHSDANQGDFILHAKGALLYVGKANSLRSRVRSYFQKTAVLEVNKQQMVTEIADIQ